MCSSQVLWELGWLTRYITLQTANMTWVTWSMIGSLCATLCKGLTTLELEADSCEALAPTSKSEIQRSARACRIPAAVNGSGKVAFFKPTDNNLSHHTLLTSSFQSKFDFMAQVFSIVGSEHAPGSNVITSVTLGSASGPPTPLKLSHLDYAELSRKLRVWDAGETGYQVHQKMSHGLN